MKAQKPLNQNDTFDLPDFLLGQVYDHVEVENGHKKWDMEESKSLAFDLKNHYNIDADPEEIYEIIMEFDRQDTEDELSN